MSKKITSQIRAWCCGAAMLSLLGIGCSQEAVGSALVDNRGASGPFSILELNGSYGAGCVGRTGNWSVPMVSLNQTTNPTLDVIRGNTACELTLQSVRVGEAEDSAQLLFSDWPVPLGGSFFASPIPFRRSPADSISFFANVRIDPDASFQSDFVIRFEYSDKPTSAGTSQGSSFSTQSASASSLGMAAPNYVPQVGGLDIKVDVNYIVQSIEGVMRLYKGTNVGSVYAVTAAPLSQTPTFDEVNQLFATAAQIDITTSPVLIDAAAFQLQGVDLTSPVKRTIIIASGTPAARSYQLLTITFVHP